MFKRRKAVLDFDGTSFNTFELNPSGVGVNEACEYSVAHNFGQNALDYYIRNGGLGNRSPREVVTAIQLAGFRTQCNTKQATDDFVSVKIERLVGGIGQRLPDGARWPRPTLGFADFWQEVKKDSAIFTAILSSGHLSFIEKAFEVHELSLPDLIVTDDELRALPEPLHKPDPRLWEYLLNKAGIPFEDVVYIGDDPKKDGQLARNAGVPFLHFAPKGTSPYCKEETFADWRDIL